jgi:hydroxymethylbilane synthase
LGTRASPLARWQADWVAAQLERHGVDVELVPLSTRGDREQAGPIGAMGGQGVFTKELQRALLAGEVDLAVHSLKDLPTDAVAGLTLAAVPPRCAAGDVLVSRRVRSWE